MVEITAAAAGGKLLDVGDDGLVIAVAERRVDLFDILVLHAFAVQEGAQDLVGGARIDVIGAQQEEALGAAAVLAQQVFHRRDRLLVRCRTGIEHVRRHLFAFVLHRVEQQPVQLLKHRQHRLARHRGPAAEHRRHLIPAQQLARLLGEQRPVGGRIHHHRLQLLPSTPPLALISSMVISATSFSGVSEIAMVPESELRMPTLMVSAACALRAVPSR